MQKAEQSKVSRQDQCTAGLKAFIKITDNWGLNREQQRVLLGNMASSSFFNLLKSKQPKLTDDQLERISYVLGIHKNLRILLRGDSVYNFVTRPIKSAAFAGKSALDVMLNGRVTDLYFVRNYLDGQRGW